MVEVSGEVYEGGFFNGRKNGVGTVVGFYG